MAVSAAHRAHWQQRLSAEAAAIAQRRSSAELQAKAAAQALAQRWPQLQGIWLFGSVLEPGFGLNSDLDLCVQGLPAAEQLEAMAVVDGLELAAPEATERLPIDLVRLEALPPHWQERLWERGRSLL